MQSSSSLKNDNRSVKFTYDNEIRRFTMKPETSLTELISIIRDLIHVEDAPLVLKYLDDENEWVTIIKELEFECALSITGSPLRLSVSLAEENRPWGRGKGCGEGKGYGRGKGCGKGKGKFRGNECNKDGCERFERGDTESETVSEKKEFKKGRGGCKGGRKWRNFDAECDSKEFRKGKRGCKGGRKWKNIDAESETASESKEFKKGRGCKGGRKWRNLNAESETASESKEFKKDRECKGGRKWRNYEEKHETESESATSVDPTLTPEEIKKKIEALVQYKRTVLEQLKEARTKLFERKQCIKEARQASERSEEMPALRMSVAEAKTAMFAVRDDLRSTKMEIKQLKQALSQKAESVSE